MQIHKIGNWRWGSNKKKPLTWFQKQKLAKKKPLKAAGVQPIAKPKRREQKRAHSTDVGKIVVRRRGRVIAEHRATTSSNLVK